MKKNKKALSMVEAVVVILVMSIWLVWIYSIYNNSIRFLDWVASRTTAIQIARSWLEAIENIRDTNWLLFSSNRQNCWNTLNYDDTCVLWSATTMSWNYKVYIENNKWMLWEDTSIWTNYNNTNYKNYYKIGLNNKWFYSQSWTTVTNVFIDSRNYTRRIEITPNTELYYINSTTGNVDSSNSSSWMTVKSIVEWTDSMSSKPRKIVLENVLTNYK